MAVNRHITASAHHGGNFTSEKLPTIALHTSCYYSARNILYNQSTFHAVLNSSTNRIYICLCIELTMLDKTKVPGYLIQSLRENGAQTFTSQKCVHFCAREDPKICAQISDGCNGPQRKTGAAEYRPSAFHVSSISTLKLKLVSVQFLQVAPDYVTVLCTHGPRAYFSDFGQI